MDAIIRSNERKLSELAAMDETVLFGGLMADDFVSCESLGKCVHVGRFVPKVVTLNEFGKLSVRLTAVQAASNRMKQEQDLPHARVNLISGPKTVQRDLDLFGSVLEIFMTRISLIFPEMQFLCLTLELFVDFALTETGMQFILVEMKNRRNEGSIANVLNALLLISRELGGSKVTFSSNGTGRIEDTDESVIMTRMMIADLRESYKKGLESKDQIRGIFEEYNGLLGPDFHRQLQLIRSDFFAIVIAMIIEEHALYNHLMQRENPAFTADLFEGRPGNRFFAFNGAVLSLEEAANNPQVTAFFDLIFTAIVELSIGNGIDVWRVTDTFERAIVVKGGIPAPDVLRKEYSGYTVFFGDDNKIVNMTQKGSSINFVSSRNKASKSFPTCDIDPSEAESLIFSAACSDFRRQYLDQRAKLGKQNQPKSPSTYSTDPRAVFRGTSSGTVTANTSHIVPQSEKRKFSLTVDNPDMIDSKSMTKQRKIWAMRIDKLFSDGLISAEEANDLHNCHLHTSKVAANHYHGRVMSDEGRSDRSRRILERVGALPPSVSLAETVQGEGLDLLARYQNACARKLHESIPSVQRVLLIDHNSIVSSSNVIILSAWVASRTDLVSEPVFSLLEQCGATRYILTKDSSPPLWRLLKAFGDISNSTRSTETFVLPRSGDSKLSEEQRDRIENMLIPFLLRAQLRFIETPCHPASTDCLLRSALRERTVVSF